MDPPRGPWGTCCACYAEHATPGSWFISKLTQFFEDINHKKQSYREHLYHSTSCQHYINRNIGEREFRFKKHFLERNECVRDLVELYLSLPTPPVRVENESWVTNSSSEGRKWIVSIHFLPTTTLSWYSLDSSTKALPNLYQQLSKSDPNWSIRSICCCLL
jgi:hypothetical protein